MAFPRRLVPVVGSGRTIDVIAAIERAVANRREQSPFKIDIINLSLGHPILESAATATRVRTVERAAAPGVIVFASAGNLRTNPNTGDIRYAGTTSPGNAPSAITVGAYDHKASTNRLEDRGAAYNSRGPTDTETNWAPTLPLCPGVQSRETDATLTCSISIDGRQFAWARNIVWGDNIVWDNIVWDNTVHYNLPTGNLPRPQEPDGTLPAAYVGWGDDDIAWAEQPDLNWDNIVWGNNIVLGQNIVWGDNPVWGRSLDDNIAWGSWDDIMWGNDDNFVRGDGVVASDARDGRAQR
jgi:Subtilase family